MTAVGLPMYGLPEVNEQLSSLLEGVQWLLGPESPVKVTGKSGISQARTRVGYEPVLKLYDEVVGPVAVADTLGAWYGKWRASAVTSADWSQKLWNNGHALAQAYNQLADAAAETQRLAKILKKNGIDPTSGQMRRS